MSIKKYAFPMAVGAALLIPTMAACGSTDPASETAEDLNAEGQILVDGWFRDIQGKKTSNLEGLLAPNFQLERADGAVLNKSQYISGLPDLRSYEISDLNALGFEDSMSVSYKAKMDLFIDGKKYPSSPTPFLSTFVKINGEWRLISHASFVVPEQN